MEVLEITAKKALEIIEAIPEDRFCADDFVNYNNTKCCVLGHLHRVLVENEEYKISIQLYAWNSTAKFRKATRDFLREKYYLTFEDISEVNNMNKINGYTEPIIKNRVVHFLEDMTKWEESNDKLPD